MSTEKTNLANETAPNPEAVDNKDNESETKDSENGDPNIALDDLFDNFDDIEDLLPNEEKIQENEEGVDNVDNFVEEVDVEAELVEPEPEPIKPWEAPDIPEPSQITILFNQKDLIMFNRFTMLQRILFIFGNIYLSVHWFGFFDVVLSGGQGDSNFYISIPLTFFASAITIGIHFVFWKHSTKWSARTFYALMTLIIGLITSEPALLLVFEGPITERTRIEQGIEKSLAVAVELQQNDLSQLTEQLCAVEATNDLSEKNETTRVHVEQLISTLQQKETELYNLQYKAEFLTSGSCERYYTSVAGESASEAKEFCQERLHSTKLKIAELERRKAKLEEDIDVLKQQIPIICEDPPGPDPYLICADEVAKMDNWYKDGLKGYGRTLLTTDTSIFTLSNCSDPNTKSTSIQTFKSDIAATLASRLESDLTHLEDDYNDIIVSKTVSARKRYEDAYKAQRDAVITLKDRKQEICEAWIFEYTTPNFFQQMSALDDIISGKPYRWPERSYAEEDCHMMLNVLKVPASETSLCANIEIQASDSQKIQYLPPISTQAKRMYYIVIGAHFTFCFWGGLILLLSRKEL